jgi:glycosyltransferase involved in cell wall biosynthesis
MEQAIADAKLGARVRYLGMVPREDIPGYLHHATINMFPSTCETSSLVQSEILGAAGVMACSNMGPMPEIAGGAAELFDPHDPDTIAACMVRLVGDEARREDLRRRAAARAATLTIETFWAAAWRAALFAHAARRERVGR